MLQKEVNVNGQLRPSRIKSFYQSQKDLTTQKKQLGNKPQNNNFKVNKYKVKYGFDASQYFFRGEKKFDLNVQKQIQDNVKVSSSQNIQGMEKSGQLVSVEKLLIMCRNLNPDIYKQLIEKYQNTDEFYNNYINKNINEQQDNIRILDQQIEDQIDYYKQTLQESTQQDIQLQNKKPDSCNKRKKYSAQSFKNSSKQYENVKINQPKFDKYDQKNLNNNYIDIDDNNHDDDNAENQPDQNINIEIEEKEIENQSHPYKFKNKLQQNLQQDQFGNLFGTQFSKNDPMLTQSNSMGIMNKNIAPKQTIQQRLFSATYKRLKLRKMESANNINRNQYSTKTNTNNGKYVPPILNDIAQRAERIFSAQNREFRKMNTQKFRNYASANTNYKNRAKEMQNTQSIKYKPNEMNVNIQQEIKINQNAIRNNTPNKFSKYSNNFTIQQMNIIQSRKNQ